MKPTGYTLVELLAVLAILSLLAMGAVPLAELARQRENERALKEALWQIRGALDEHKRAVEAGLIARPANGSGYPPSLKTLSDGVLDLQGRPMYFLRSVPRDPFAAPALPADATWTLRSYASPPDRPTSGADVYDVHSTSQRMGSNGIPLSEW